MSDRISAHPELYAPDAQGAPSLNGGRCRSCGYVFFPPQSYGCEVCGSADLESIALAGRGTLRAFATVHLHQGKGIEAPFTVASILLEGGPIIRTILKERTDAGLRIGDRMQSVFVPAGAEASGKEIVELRFTKTGVEK